MRSLYKIHISDKCNKNDIIRFIKDSKTDYVILQDIFTTTIDYIDDLVFDKNTLYIPQVLSVNKENGQPIGNVINHISITQSMKIQSVYASEDMEPDYIPNCVIGHRNILIKLLSKCSSVEGLFLELSLIVKNYNCSIKLVPGWIAKTYVSNRSNSIRSRLVSKYMPMFVDMFDIQDNITSVLSELCVENPKNGLYNLKSIIEGNDILLVDSHSKDYESIRFNYRTFSLDPYIPSDFYIALSGQDPTTFDPRKSFMQLTMNSSSSKFVVDTTSLDPIGTFCVKQFSDNISFSPPYTSSTNNILTALEIILSFKPRNILVVSNETIKDLFTSDNKERIRRETFMSKIFEYCYETDVKLKLMSDLNSLFTNNV